MEKIELYYVPPRQELFEAVKSRAMELWKEMDDGYGYATEKINRIKDIQNIEDNFMAMVAMFDINNQRKLSDRLAQETKDAIRERMISGGTPEECIVF